MVFLDVPVLLFFLPLLALESVSHSGSDSMSYSDKSTLRLASCTMDERLPPKPRLPRRVLRNGVSEEGTNPGEAAGVEGADLCDTALIEYERGRICWAVGTSRTLAFALFNG